MTVLLGAVFEARFLLPPSTGKIEMGVKGFSV
jgi:hypothetical protein